MTSSKNASRTMPSPILWVVSLLLVAVVATFALLPLVQQAKGDSATRTAVAEALKSKLAADGLPVVSISWDDQVAPSAPSSGYVVLLKSASQNGRGTSDDSAARAVVIREASILKGRGSNIDAIAIKSVDASGVVVAAIDMAVEPQVPPVSVPDDEATALRESAGRNLNDLANSLSLDLPAVVLNQAEDGTRVVAATYEIGAESVGQLVDQELLLSRAASAIAYAVKSTGVVAHETIVKLVDRTRQETLAEYDLYYDGNGVETARAAHFAKAFTPRIWRLHSQG